MKTRRWMFVLLLAGSGASTWPQVTEAQCCLDAFFAGCATCFRKPQAYAVAPVMAPVPAPIPAPPPPVVVPVQQVSYVPETTYRTQYQNVPVTSYKPSTEIDPCTGCPRECMQQVTNYVQQAVNVPVTQYRAVYSTKYVQMQQGAPAYSAPAAAPVYPGAVAAPAMPAAGVGTSPFAAPVQTTPQAWGAAGADIPQQVLPGQTSIAAPTLPQGFVPPPAPQTMTVPNTVPAPGVVQQPAFGQPTFQQQIVPQSGMNQSGATYAAPAPNGQLQPTQPPALTPTPALKPIPEMPRPPVPQAGVQSGTAPQTFAPPSFKPLSPPAVSGSVPAMSGTAPAISPFTAPSGTAPASGTNGAVGPTTMPVVPGSGPGASTGAFPRLLEPTSHTTSWRPVSVAPMGSPTAALPGRLQ